MALDPRTGRRAPPPRPAAKPGPLHTAASMLGAAMNERVADEPDPRRLPASLLPSEMPEPDPEPTFGSTGGRTRMHEPSAAAMAAGFGEASADGVADLPEQPAPFLRRSGASRIPFGVREQRMAWPPMPGFHLHWFNDEPGRIRRAEMAGYSFVEVNGRNISTTVGVDRGGKSMQAFLMKVPQEWFDEDRQAIEHEQNTILSSIERGAFQSGNKSYVPQQGIHVRSVLERR